MDVIQICPPKKLNLTLPLDTQRVLTITNLTLRSVFVHILQSHHYQLTLSQSTFILQAFQEVKVSVAVRWNQAALNICSGKLRILYFQINEQQPDIQALLQKMVDNFSNVQQHDIIVNMTFDDKICKSINYQQFFDAGEVRHRWIGKQLQKQTYVMKIVYPANPDEELFPKEQLQQQIFSFLQQKTYINTIQPSKNGQRYVMDVKTQTKEQCQFINFYVESHRFIYVLAKVIAYGNTVKHPQLVDLGNKKIKTYPVTTKQITMSAVQQPVPKQNITTVSETIISQVANQQIQNKVKNSAQLKQSFAVKMESKPRKRRNKSQEKICQRLSESQQQNFIEKQQILNLRKAKDYNTVAPVPVPASVPVSVPVTKKVEVVTKQTNIELGQKVLNIVTITKQNCTQIYVLLKDCLLCYVVEDPSAKRTFKFQPMNEESVYLPCPIDFYQTEAIFGNQSYLFWVDLQTGQSQWKYVQRKHIYALAVIEQLSLVALGGKNFSKLSYFGKDTSRSNIKMYSCGSSDKHDHLFTYDMPGDNVGNVANMAYISTPPNAHKILLVHTLNQQNSSCFYFLRVKAFNKIEVYGQLDLDQLGILNLLKFKHNRVTGRLMTMQSVNQSIDSFKRMKVKCMYQKVDVNTQGMKFPMTRYSSYQIGGGKGKNDEWIGALQENGRVAHLYYFETNEYQKVQLQRQGVRQVFSVNRNQYLVLCGETVVSIRERVQIKE